MSTITQTSFTNTLNRRGGYIDVRNMSPELEQELTDAGITDEQLREIAGQDLAIRGSAEFDSLFRRIDRLEGPADARFTTHDASGGLTRAGRVYQALQQEVDSNRARAAREGGLRFAGDATLDQVMDGRAALSEGVSGEHVRKVQEALIDLGFDIATSGASGTFDRETARAVARFQREMGLSMHGTVDAETLGALASVAPPPGHRIERSADYDRLYADGRVDIALAIGAPESGSAAREQREVLSGLRRDGWRPLDYASLSPEERQRFGLTADRYDPNALYFTKQLEDPRTGEPVDAVIRMVTPGFDGRSRRSFEQAMQQDEVVYCSGHARFESGPESASGAGLRSTIQGRASDLARMRNRPDYQLLMLNGPATENELPGLRSSLLFARSHQDTNIVATTLPTSADTRGQHALRFLQGITSRESNNSLLGAMSRIEEGHLRRFDDGIAGRARHTFTESGFLSNSTNRVVRYARPES